MRSFVVTTLLVPRYRPAPAADDPLVVDARRRAWRDREEGTGPPDWPVEQREAWRTDQKAHFALMSEYNVFRHPEQVGAPPAWYDAVVILAAWTVLQAAAPEPGGWRAELLLAVAMNVLGSPIMAFTQRARRRSARRLGLTAATAPRVGWAPVTPAYLGVFLASEVWRLVRRVPPTPRPSWPVYLAGQIVREINDRRAWRRALRG